MRPGPVGGDYGCDHFGRLRRVLLHRPGEALRVITEANYRDWLFDEVPDVTRFNDEHDRYAELLESVSVEVVQLADCVVQNRDLMERLPNLTYLHDVAVISRVGAVLSSMAWDGRSGEEIVVREALERLGVPIFTDFRASDDAFEGCLLLSPETVLVANTERHRRATIDKFIPRALEVFKEVIYADIPQSRRYMHPDTVFNRVTRDLALVYLPAFTATRLCTRGGCKAIDLVSHMAKKGVELVSVSEDEQRRLACSFVPLEPGVILHYDTALDRQTQLLLNSKGVELVLFHPQALVAGGGSLRCLTLMLHRDGKR
jgi:arginine deiminase